MLLEALAAWVLHICLLGDWDLGGRLLGHAICFVIVKGSFAWPKVV